MFYIPSYEECVKICESTQKTLFYESQFFIDGFKISIFNYRLATYQDFVIHNAFELRGITFVFNKDGSLYRRFILMEKFFNLNENDSTQFDKLNSKSIKSVYEKIDGSIISFIELPNGKILAKSKTSFESPQSKLAQKIFNENDSIKTIVKSYLKNDITPIFELISPQNQIVLRYKMDELVLLKLRNNKTGEYLPIDSVNHKLPMKFYLTLDELVNLSHTKENTEGWIVEFSDSQKIKIKTKWYLTLHKAMTETSYREDSLIEMIIDEKIDDLLCMLDSGSDARKFVDETITKTRLKISKLSNDVDLLLSKYRGDRKTFSIEYHKHDLFGIVMKVISGGDKFSSMMEYIKKKTYRLESARDWLKSE
jgi:RNA ligase